VTPELADSEQPSVVDRLPSMIAKPTGCEKRRRASSDYRLTNRKAR
jgi:hypothetical protein